MAKRIEPGFDGAILDGASVDQTEATRLVGLAQAKIVTKTVTVAIGQLTGTATVVAGSTPIGILPAGNQDQYVDNVAIATTVLTVTLAAAATAANTYKVTVLEP